MRGGVEAEALRVGDVELLDTLVGPLLPHSVLQSALVQFVQPVVEDLAVQNYECIDRSTGHTGML